MRGKCNHPDCTIKIAHFINEISSAWLHRENKSTGLKLLKIVDKILKKEKKKIRAIPKPFKCCVRKMSRHFHNPQVLPRHKKRTNASFYLRSHCTKAELGAQRHAKGWRIWNTSLLTFLFKNSIMLNRKNGYLTMPTITRFGLGSQLI